MTPEQIIASVADRLGPMPEWPLADPSALVEAWRAVLSGDERARADRLAVALRGLSIACDMTDAAANDPHGSAMDEASAFYAAAKVHAAGALAQEQA